MAEQSLYKNRGNLKIAVLRPSSIYATSVHPFPGWADSIATVGKHLYPMGMGLSDTFALKPGTTQIFVPCDVVVNAMLVTGMVVAKIP